MSFVHKITSKLRGFVRNPVIEHIAPIRNNSMIGAGVRKLEKEFVTHTTLHEHKSAVHTFVFWQKMFLLLIVGVFTTGLIVNWLLTLQIVVGLLTVIYFIDVLFNLFLVLKSLHLPPELDYDEKELSKIKDEELPMYTILCPMYKEAKIIPAFLDAINKLDYPKNKLDVQLLLEEDDVESISAAKNYGLPKYVRAVVVPHSQPKTKPKACNYGLNLAKGKYLVIYDAEDIPDPRQLKKAYLAFQNVDSNVVCLQAKLNYFNPHQNFITRLFTAEYSLWFDVVLPGLQGINTNIPLGGTSNHFRIEDLKKLEGWDPFNVTEDCDLGVRLFMEGKKTAVINSTTLEEANSKFKNWLRQRSRWIKGYMQTYLVHMRNPYQLVKKQGIHALFFNLVVGGKIAFMFINPFLWMATIGYFAMHAQLGAIIESLFPSYIFYMALFSLVFGNFLFMFYYMIGCAKRDHWSVVKYVYLIPFYWIMTSIAAVIALQQLFFKPHYWEKTVHGLHLPAKEQLIAEIINDVEVVESSGLNVSGLRINNLRKIKSSFSKNHLFGGFLVLSTALASVLNFVFAAFLGRILSLEEFALLSFVAGLLSFVGIISSSFGATINHRSGYLAGQYGEAVSYAFWRKFRNRSLIFSLIAALVWVALAPVLINYFQIKSIMPIILFAPVILTGFAYAADRGFLSSRLNFARLGLLGLFEPITKIAAVLLVVWYGVNELAYLSIPFSVVSAFLLGWFFVLFRNKSEDNNQNKVNINLFPKKFFLASLISGLSTVIFLSMDVILAKHYLSPADAGIYSLVSLISKMIFFLGSLVTPFIMPLVSRNEGANIDSRKILNFTLIGTLFLSLPAFVILGVFGKIVTPIVFGDKAYLTLPYLLPVTFAMVLFTLSRVYSEYYLARKFYTFPILALVVGVAQLFLLEIFHQSIWSFVLVITASWISYFIATVLLHIFADQVRVVENNVGDLFALFKKLRGSKQKTKGQLSILIFNWRDTKHVWGGGSETYIHEVAKRWVKDGNTVTVFCGNDGRSSRNDVIDGVRIVRRGGFYTVYFWAFVYYVLKFRGSFDVVVDSENGLPFFTPLFVRVPKFLLIHHIHQEVFRMHLSFPFSHIAMLLESKLMPLVYHNQRLITVSESSKKEILKMRLSKFRSVEIINPGINSSEYQLKKKTSYVSILYLGRLKPYKNVDVALKAFAEIIKIKKDAIFYIAGVGESLDQLRDLANSLGISDSVKFLGRVSDSEKSDLLSSCWVMLQPSMIEGWGITVIEANASGTPVIASNVNGLKDSIVDGVTGRLVKPCDYRDLAEKVLTLVGNKKKLQKFSIEAYSWSKKFSWDLSAKAFLNQLKIAVTRNDLSKVDQLDGKLNKNYVQVK